MAAVFDRFVKPSEALGMARSVLVTGASTGIGEACALHLDRLGHRVYAGVRKESDAERLSSQGSERLTPVFLDVTDEGQIEATAKQIEADGGGLAGVVNNAGVARGGPLEFLPIDEWREQIEVNVIGQIAVTKECLPLLRPERGRVVFIGSIGGRVGSFFMGPYNASKFALEGVADALRQELHPWGMHVAIVEPGSIKTPIWEKGRATLERLDEQLSAEARELYRDMIESFRAGIDETESRGVGPEKVAKAVEHALFHRRPWARYLVGPDAKAMGIGARFLPDRAKDALVRRFAPG